MKIEKTKWLALCATIFLLAVFPRKSTAGVLADLFREAFLAHAQQAPSPILIIPGLTGSQLEAQDTGEGFPLCSTLGLYAHLWIDYFRFPLCGRRELTLQYDSVTDTYEDNPHVDIRAVDFGGTKGVEYLTKSVLTHPFSKYFHEFVEHFVNDYNYERGKSIRAAPYDWRLAADELERRGYYDQVMTLIQKMYDDNGQQKVTIVGHSMGGPVSHHFLTRYKKMTQKWKDKYIHAYVPLAGAWSGGNSALHVVISGVGGLINSIPLGNLPGVSKYLATFVNSLESTYWMMPRESVWGNTPLVKTPSSTYTATELDYKQLFEDLGNKDGYAKYSGVQASSPDFPPPNIQTHCFYGVGEKTEKQFEYSEDFNGEAPFGQKPHKIVYGDGDGVVNIESSEMCLAWRSMASRYPFEHKTFDGIDHGNIVMNEIIFDEIARIVGATLKT